MMTDDTIAKRTK